jgi:hypothetical protein
MKILLEKYIQSNYYNNIINNIHKENLILIDWTKSHLVDVDKTLSNIDPNDDSILVIGPIEFVEKCQKLKTKWQIFANWENFEYLTYEKHFNKFMLNRKYIVCNAKSLENTFSMLKTDKLFVRPNSSKKLFSGTIVSLDTFSDDSKKKIFFYGIDDNELCIVSKVKDISDEFRVVINENEIMSMCKYDKISDKYTTINSTDEKNILNFVYDVFKNVKWKPERLFVMDVCKSNNEFKIVELNTFSASDLYECDVDLILKKL